MIERMFADLAKSIAAAIVAVSLFGTAARAAEQQSHYVLVQSALEKHVVPGFEAFASNAARLPDAVTKLCNAPDDAAREIARAAFRDTVLSWAAIEFLRFGPMTQDGRRERISFWPDPRAVMGRQLRQLITSKDLKAIEGGAIAKQSAAVQGLPALEVLLTDKETPLAPGDAAQFRCALAVAIAGNVRTLADELLQAWTKAGGWKDKLLRPGSDNDTYKEPQESASELVKALLVGFQLIGDGQVKPHIDAKVPFAGPYAKSSLSKFYFSAGVASLDTLYEAMALESYLPEDKDWVKNWAGGAWKTLKASDGAGGRADGVAKGDEQPVKKVLAMFSGLRKLVTGELSVAAGLTVGFNELDGD